MHLTASNWQSQEMHKSVEEGPFTFKSNKIAFGHQDQSSLQLQLHKQNTKTLNSQYGDTNSDMIDIEESQTRVNDKLSLVSEIHTKGGDAETALNGKYTQFTNSTSPPRLLKPTAANNTQVPPAEKHSSSGRDTTHYKRAKTPAVDSPITRDTRAAGSSIGDLELQTPWQNDESCPDSWSLWPKSDESDDESWYEREEDGWWRREGGWHEEGDLSYRGRLGEDRRRGNKGWRGRRREHVVETEVTVVVKDINDNAPVFPNTTVYGEMQENGEAGT